MGQRIVGDFEQMALLRIDLLGFARAHAEGGGVEAPDVVDHAGGEGVAAAALVGGGMVECSVGKRSGVIQPTDDLFALSSPQKSSTLPAPGNRPA